ncbi:MAG: tetratricopeptide repeat protein [bacterium]
MRFKIDSIKQNKEEIFNCSICGTENPSTNLHCENCGGLLRNKHVSSGKHSDSANRDTDGKNNPVAKKTSSQKPTKPLNLKTTSLMYIVIALFVFGAVILFAAGVFDSPGVPQIAQVSNNSPDPHGGADLEQLQKINDLEKVVENNPGDYDSLLKLAHALNDSGFYERAIEMYEKYLAVNAQNADVFVDEGVCYYQLKKYDAAVATMKKALEINPKHQIAHFNLGIVNFSNNKIDEAKMWWKKAVELDPSTEIAAKAQELINSN